MHGAYVRQKKRVTARITLVSGESEEGVFLMPLDDTLEKLMNGTLPFIEYEDADGKLNLMAKAALIRVVELGEVQVKQEIPPVLVATESN